MKRVKFILIGLSLFLLSGASLPPDNNFTYITSADNKLPNWQWTSGEVSVGNKAMKEIFTLAFDKSIYQPNDSVKIIFNSYKVAIANLNKGTTFDEWWATVHIVYSLNNNWPPLVKDTNARINKFFIGKRNKLIDSLTNYVIRTTVPLNRILVLTVRLNGWGNSGFDNITQGPGTPIFVNGNEFPAFTTSIKGLEVEKIAAK